MSITDLFGGGQQDESGKRMEEEEGRKAALRRRIDAFYGIADQEEVPGFAGSRFSKLAQPVGQMVRDRNAALETGATAARTSMGDEETKLADATRAYYTDQLGKTFAEASRNTRFKLARQGLLGGSEDANQQGEVTSDRDLGATRVDEAVRRAVSQLKTQREQERLNAIGLVNSGSGESAVSAAQTGLRNSLENVSSQQKADLFSDLFTHAADIGTANNAQNQAALLNARIRDGITSFFPVRTTTSGRVTAS